MSSPNTSTLVVATAKSIQSFVLGGDKLKQMIGASELIDAIPRGLLDSTLRAIGGEVEVISKAAGGARILFSDHDVAMRFARVWPVVVWRFAPGLELVVAVQPWSESHEATRFAAEAQLAVNRQFCAALLPLPSPLAVRVRRTGLPAVGLDEKQQAADALWKRKAAASSGNAVLQRVLPDGFDASQFPTDMEKLAGSEREYVAVIHMDGNQLGRLITAISDARQ